MRADIFILAVASLCMVLIPIGLLFVRTAAAAFRERRWSPVDRWVLTAALLLLALLFLRPHQHVYQALDSSAFRHMARAFLAGRGFHDRDAAFAALPREVRPWVLLTPTDFARGERATRDRSFQIDGLDNARTRPFFYPLLPLNMAALGALTTAPLMDAFVPLVFLIFWAALLLVAGGRAGGRGMLLILALAIASPLPAWLGRGCYLETVSSALLGLAVLNGLSLKEGNPPSRAAFFALGLAVAYHPIMILMALPLGVALLFACRSGSRRLAGIGAGVLGVLPLLAMTEWICAPYGALRAAPLKAAILHNAYIRPAFFLVVLLTLALAGGGLLVRLKRPRLRAINIGWGRALALVLFWTTPTLLALQAGTGSELSSTVMRGWREWLDGTRLPLVVLMALLLLAVARLPGRGGERWVATAVALAFPVFLHLKGLESMGLWSQRRLLAPWVLLLIVSGLAGAALLSYRRRLPRRFAWVPELLLAGVLLTGLANAVRWPAPYLVRYEAGGDAFVAQLDREWAGATVLFDYHTHSLPLAVLPGRRVYGLSEEAAPGMPAVAAWVREQAATNAVFWVTAFENPGIEEGVRLRSLGRRSVTLERVRSKSSLPALREQLVVRHDVLRVEPLQAGEAAILDKTFDQGAGNGANRPQLALRGPWGRGGLAIAGPDGSPLPAQWTRQGSSVIGPLPPPGGRLRIMLEAAASRQDGQPHQIITLVPPWGGEGVVLRVEQGYTRVEGLLLRPESDRDEAATGRYRLDARWPYDPAAAGIRGFDPDLGILLHRLRLESLPH